MKLSILNVTSRSIVVERTGCGIYQSDESCELYLNGEWVQNTDKIIISIYGLRPNTEYGLQIKENSVLSEVYQFKTKEEFVTLNVRDFGAKGDGIKDDTLSIQSAILSCPRNSRVLIPQGIYKVSSLFLKSDLNLELGKGAVLSAFTERDKFPVLPGLIESYDEKSDYNLGSWEGNPLDTFASIITGIEVKNVCIYGEGEVNGCAGFDNWWKEPKKKIIAYRPRMIFLNHCENVVVHGITIKNSPSWNVHPYFSNHLRFYDLKILGPANSHNTDGIDPESCMDVEIAGVYFSVGDDCIAVKSGKIYMGKKYKVPSKDIRIRQSLMENGHGAVTIGSEIGAGVSNLEVKDCLFFNTDRGLRIKTRRGRGEDSVIDQVIFQNIKMEQVKVPFVVNSFYYCDPDGKSDYVGSMEALPIDERTPVVKELIFKNIICKDCHYAGAYIYGLPERKIESVVMHKVKITFDREAETGVAAMMDGCEPSCKQGIFIRNVENTVLEEVEVEGCDGEPIVIQ